ncbi:MAG: DUF1294 domain-containing protein [Oscillospiraceae bacterium]
MAEYIVIGAAAYVAVISMIGWILPYADKKRARNGSWRIPEKTLFVVAALGGSAAMYASMKKYRHKTKHKRFMIGIPCIMIAQAALIAAAVILYMK